jgi:cytochrome b6-f complex iron-sulfur subunit
MKINESHIERRNFLCGMIGGGAAAMAAGITPPVVYYTVNPHEEPLPEFMAFEPDQWQAALAKSKYLSYGRVKVLLVRPSETEELRVFDAKCTHAECNVGFKKDENRLFCPCHIAYYDLDGQVLSGPPPKPLKQFYHKFVGETLIVALEKENLDQAT